MVRSVLPVVVAMGLLLGLGSPASAHDYLVGSSPRAGSTIQRDPGRVRLTFNDVVLTRPIRSVLWVTGPDGRHYETGCADVVDRQVSVPVRLGPAGRYTAQWRIASADGHPVTSSITFQYRPSRSTVAVQAAGAALDCGQAQPAGHAGGPPAWLPVVILVAALGAVAVVLGRRGRRSRGGAVVR